jgi:formylglycine-generating enzyme required for sulfatase activity
LVVRTDDSPQTALTWYEAAHYCDWLSEHERISRDQWCYDPPGGVYAAGMKAKPKFWELKGYRLPTDAEWEYACRAGTLTSRYYGFSDRLLPQYAWFVANAESRVWPTGTLEPNDLGLFDMFGNAMEWCFDRYADVAQRNQEFEDKPPTEPVKAEDRRVLRGGGIFARPPTVRSDYPLSNPPDYRGPDMGFRPVRTYP